MRALKKGPFRDPKNGRFWAILAHFRGLGGNDPPTWHARQRGPVIPEDDLTGHSLKAYNKAEDGEYKLFYIKHHKKHLDEWCKAHRAALGAAAKADSKRPGVA